MKLNPYDTRTKEICEEFRGIGLEWIGRTNDHAFARPAPYWAIHFLYFPTHSGRNEKYLIPVKRICIAEARSCLLLICLDKSNLTVVHNDNVREIHNVCTNIHPVQNENIYLNRSNIMHRLIP